jgi:hypothetical protein
MGEVTASKDEGDAKKGKPRQAGDHTRKKWYDRPARTT